MQRQRTQHQDVAAHVLFVLCPFRPLLLQGVRRPTGSAQGASRHQGVVGDGQHRSQQQQRNGHESPVESRRETETLGQRQNGKITELLREGTGKQKMVKKKTFLTLEN